MWEIDLRLPGRDVDGSTAKKSKFCLYRSNCTISYGRLKQHIKYCKLLAFVSVGGRESRNYTRETGTLVAD